MFHRPNAPQWLGSGSYQPPTTTGPRATRQSSNCSNTLPKRAHAPPQKQEREGREQTTTVSKKGCYNNERDGLGTTTTTTTTPDNVIDSRSPLGTPNSSILKKRPSYTRRDGAGFDSFHHFITELDLLFASSCRPWMAVLIPWIGFLVCRYLPSLGLWPVIGSLLFFFVILDGVGHRLGWWNSQPTTNRNLSSELSLSHENPLTVDASRSYQNNGIPTPSTESSTEIISTEAFLEDKAVQFKGDTKFHRLPRPTSRQHRATIQHRNEKKEQPISPVSPHSTPKRNGKRTIALGTKKKRKETGQTSPFHTHNTTRQQKCVKIENDHPSKTQLSTSNENNIDVENEDPSQARRKELENNPYRNQDQEQSASLLEWASAANTSRAQIGGDTPIARLRSMRNAKAKRSNQATAMATAEHNRRDHQRYG